MTLRSLLRVLPARLGPAVLVAFGIPAITLAQQTTAPTLADLDTLSEIATNETEGLALARSLADAGRYLEALAAIERVLANHPRSREGLLLHARYLCLIDDTQGGLVELGLLRERDYPAGELVAERAACTARQGG